MLPAPLSSEGCVTGCSPGPVMPPRGSRWPSQGGELRGTGEPGRGNPLPFFGGPWGWVRGGRGSAKTAWVEESGSHTTWMVQRGNHMVLNWGRNRILQNAGFFWDENTGTWKCSKGRETLTPSQGRWGESSPPRSGAQDLTQLLPVHTILLLWPDCQTRKRTTCKGRAGVPCVHSTV